MAGYYIYEASLKTLVYRFHRDNLKMVNEANECQLYDQANYITFIARAFHITDKVGSIHPDFSHCTANIHIRRSITENHL